MYQYRKDIDGLRAFAILSVLLFHAGLSFFSGGYVGVDVFFVISGYLITSIIVVELDRDRFTVLGFYERRVRRIFPALFSVLFFSIIAAQLLMLPNEDKDFGQSVVSTAFFASNILFWIEAGYFDAESLMKPLLHTWSLAVEEQYYLFYPPLLILIYKFMNRNGLPLIVGIWAASLAWSVWSTTQHPVAAFYLAPSRIWELLTGSILALGYVRGIESRVVNEVIGVLGLLMIVYAVVGFDHTTAFPGYLALIPVVGTAMVIYSGTAHHTWVSRLLSIRFLVFTGLISYSLYLWHWPILVFTHLYLDMPFPSWLIALLLTLSYFFAWFSWRYIERPFRGKQSTVTRRQMFYGSAVVMTGVAAFGLLLHFSQGLRERIPEHVNEIVELIESSHSYLPADCLRKDGADFSQGVSPCALEEEKGDSPSVVLWGDSHAAALVPGLIMLAERHASVETGFVGMLGCPPLKGILLAHNEHSAYHDCTKFNDLVLRELAADRQVDVVMLAAYWSLYANGIRKETDPNPGNVFLCPVDDCRTEDTKDNPEFMKRGLSAIIDTLSAQGKQVVLIGPVPELDINGAATIARMELLHNEREIRPSRASTESSMESALSVMKELERETGVQLLFPHTVLCDSDYCNAAFDDMPLYIDRHHLSPVGAEYVMQHLAVDELFSTALSTLSRDDYPFRRKMQ